MASLATSIQDAILRSQRGIMESLAKDGLRALESAIANSGLKDSPYMSGYELYSKATATTVEFEIHLSTEAFEDPTVLEPIPEEEVDEEGVTATEKAELKLALKMFTLSRDMKPTRVAKMRDMRTPAHDARTRKTGVVRSPVAIRPTVDGKLAVDTKKTAKVGADGSTTLPQGSFQGVMGDFIQQLKDLMAEQLTAALQKSLGKYS